jgi:ABC-type sulfate/molybdate transport systems ATPase subunit
MGLASLTERTASDLSGGQRQRVGIARALAYEPHALFLDEPFSDLDPPLRLRLRRDILSHIREFPLPVILVTHDRSKAFELCDRIGVMLDGTISQADEPGELWQSPRTLAVAEFIGYSNRIAGTLDQIEGAEALFTTSMGRCRARITAERSSSARDAVLVCQLSSVRPASGSESHGNMFTFRLESSHQTESFTSLTLVNAEGDVWTAHWPEPPSVSPGEELRCVVFPEHLLAYSADALP